jgi:hypothetical protein
MLKTTAQVNLPTAYLLVKVEKRNFGQKDLSLDDSGSTFIW